jgi:hypothetical protein
MVGKYLSIRALNEFTEGARTISGGRLFHRGAILFDRKWFLGRHVVICLVVLKLWPLVL